MKEKLTEQYNFMIINNRIGTSIIIHVPLVLG